MTKQMQNSLVSFIVFIICASMSTQAIALTGEEIAKINKQAGENYETDMINKAEIMAENMEKLAQNMAINATANEQYFFIEEQSYWKQIQADAEYYINSEMNYSSRFSYLLTTAYWTAMREKYSEAINNNPKESAYFSMAVNHIDTYTSELSDTGTTAHDEAVSQNAINRDGANFDKRYTTFLQQKDSFNFLKIFLIIGGIGVIATVVILIIVLTHKKRSPTPPRFTR